MIGDIHYEPHDGPSWLVCDRDGTRLDAPSPDVLAQLWASHGGVVQRADRDIASGRTRRPTRVPMCKFDGCDKFKTGRSPISGYCVTHGRQMAVA